MSGVLRRLKVVRDAATAVAADQDIELIVLIVRSQRDAEYLLAVRAGETYA